MTQWPLRAPRSISNNEPLVPVPGAGPRVSLPQGLPQDTDLSAGEQELWPSLEGRKENALGTHGSGMGRSKGK